MKSRVCAPAPTFPPFVFLAFLGCLGLGCLAGCKGDRLLEPDQTGAGSSATTNTKATAAVPPPPSAKGPKIQFVKAAGGEVAPLVKTERENAGKNQRSFLVYVGASWCEPCQRFHEAAAHGELDPELPAITLLEFDADNDTGRLRQAGYASTYIPLFAVPNADGRASGRFIEGGVKGQGAAREIVPRLTKLLSP